MNQYTHLRQNKAVDTHIYTKDDNKEKTRVQYCMEIEEIFVNFVYPQRGSSASNKYTILHAIHQSEVRTTLNALHQSKFVNAWKASLLNIFRCIGCLRGWGKLFHAKEPEKKRLVLKNINPCPRQKLFTSMNEKTFRRNHDIFQASWSFTVNNLLH